MSTLLLPTIMGIPNLIPGCWAWVILFVAGLSAYYGIERQAYEQELFRQTLVKDVERGLRSSKRDRDAKRREVEAERREIEEIEEAIRSEERNRDKLDEAIKSAEQTLLRQYQQVSNPPISSYSPAYEKLTTKFIQASGELWAARLLQDWKSAIIETVESKLRENGEIICSGSILNAKEAEAWHNDMDSCLDAVIRHLLGGVMAMADDNTETSLDLMVLSLRKIKNEAMRMFGDASKTGIFPVGPHPIEVMEAGIERAGECFDNLITRLLFFRKNELA